MRPEICMIKLHTFGRMFGLPDPSPFVTKVVSETEKRLLVNVLEVDARACPVASVMSPRSGARVAVILPFMVSAVNETWPRDTIP